MSDGIVLEVLLGDRVGEEHLFDLVVEGDLQTAQSPIMNSSDSIGR